MKHWILLFVLVIAKVQSTTWFGFNVVPDLDPSDTKGVAVFSTFDDQTAKFSDLWNCSYNLYDPSSAENYYLEVGPVVSISDDRRFFVFAQFGGTSFQSSSLIKVDMQSRKCYQGPVTNTGFYHTLKYDSIKNTIIGIRDIETWTVVYEELSTDNLKPINTLYTDKSPHGNAPQGLGASYDPKNRLLSHVVEYDYYDNYWQLLNFSTVPATVGVYHLFTKNWAPSTLTYDPKTNKLAATYQNINDKQNGEPQAFFIDPVDGSWPLQGTKVSPLGTDTVPSNDAPIQYVNGKAQMLLMLPPPSPPAVQDTCGAMLLDFDTLTTIWQQNVTCTPFNYENWNWC